MTQSIPLEDQVCSKKYSEEIKNLGVKQESLWVWATWKEPGDECVVLESQLNSDYWTNVPWVIASAFTCAELGEMLPIKRYDDDMRKQIWEWEEAGDTEANARAKMLIRLIKMGVIKV